MIGSEEASLYVPGHDLKVKQVDVFGPLGWLSADDIGYGVSRSESPSFCLELGRGCRAPADVSEFFDLRLKGIADSAIAIAKDDSTFMFTPVVIYLANGVKTQYEVTVDDISPITATTSLAVVKSTGQAYLLETDVLTPIGEALPSGRLLPKAFAPESYSVATQGQVYRWDRTSWVALGSLPYSNFDITKLDGTGPDDLWALGNEPGGPNRLVHWNGSVWAKVDLNVEATDFDIAGNVFGVKLSLFGSTFLRVLHRIDTPSVIQR